MRSHAIEKVHISSHCFIQFFNGMVIIVRQLLTFHDAEKRFRYCVVIRCPWVGERLGHTAIPQILPKFIGGILQPLIAVKRQSRWSVSCNEGDLKRSQDKSRVIFIRNLIGKYFAGKYVDDDTDRIKIPIDAGISYNRLPIEGLGLSEQNSALRGFGDTYISDWYC